MIRYEEDKKIYYVYVTSNRKCKWSEKIYIITWMERYDMLCGVAEALVSKLLFLRDKRFADRQTRTHPVEQRERTKYKIYNGG